MRGDFGGRAALLRQCWCCCGFQRVGRPGRIEGTRELVARRKPCIVASRGDKDGVRILRVLHSALLWLGGLADLS